LLLAEDQIELRIFRIDVSILGVRIRTEHDHNTVLQEVVELDRIRVETLALQIMDPIGIMDQNTNNST
jgi:hypothetical protein